MLCDSTWRSCHEHWSSPWFGAAAPGRHITGYLSHQRLVLKNRFRLYRFWRGSASKLFTERNNRLQKARGVIAATRAVSGVPYVQRTSVAQLSPTHNFDPFYANTFVETWHKKSASRDCNHVISGRT
jgi:hypothetical protein